MKGQKMQALNSMVPALMRARAILAIVSLVLAVVWMSPANAQVTEEQLRQAVEEAYKRRYETGRREGYSSGLRKRDFRGWKIGG